MITQLQLTDLFEYRDGALFWKKRQGRMAAGTRAGSLKYSGYRHVKIGGKLYQEHRLIYLMHHGSLPDILDHINGVCSDNRVENLRPCTMRQNIYNARMRSDNTSGVKGVHWCKALNRWRAEISIAGKRKLLGGFNTIEEAKTAITAARDVCHGEFARHE